MLLWHTNRSNVLAIDGHAKWLRGAAVATATYLTHRTST